MRPREGVSEFGSRKRYPNAAIWRTSAIALRMCIWVQKRSGSNNSGTNSVQFVPIRRGFDQSILGWLGNAIELQYILAHRKRVWIGRHRIKANLKASETHLDRRASSGNEFDRPAKTFFLSVAMPAMHFVRQASSGSETTRQAGKAIKTPSAFRATSVERERNHGGVNLNHLLSQFSFSRQT